MPERTSPKDLMALLRGTPAMAEEQDPAVDPADLDEGRDPYRIVTLTQSIGSYTLSISIPVDLTDAEYERWRPIIAVFIHPPEEQPDGPRQA